MGPEGIIFPMMRTPEEVREMIGATLYPPHGTRGFGPMRAIRYGETDCKYYTDEESLELCRFMQIEHVECVENLEEIVKIPYIDGFIFGPNDLSGSLGELGNVFGEKTMEQIRRALKIVKENGKYVGLATGDLRPETLKFWSELGIDMMTVGADWNFVFDAAKNTRKLLQQYHMEA
jgi:2-dehydro-3-deoxyglucarate aldolase/4-hydroxy-2-oxoheptanedioate aldolase